MQHPTKYRLHFALHCRCPVRVADGYGATCAKEVPSCAGPHCVGRVHCATTACPDWEGVLCFYDGASNNWKVSRQLVHSVSSATDEHTN